MAEHWKSTPRYWCKQCKIFIRDTGFEKSQHEATAKHQGNLKRFLRDIHRDNERQQRETQRAKNEVERLRQTVAGGPAKSSGAGAGGAPPWKAAAAAAPRAPERPVPLEERKKQMAQLAEMGIAIPGEFRGDMALAGEWETVSETVVGEVDGKGLSRGVRKRKHVADEEEEEAKREAERFVSKGWGSRTREYPGAMDDGDLDALLASTAEVKKVKSSTVPDLTAPEASTAPGGKDGEIAEASRAEDTPAVELSQETPAKEESAEAGSVPLDLVAKTEEEATPGVVFKKRKPKVLRK
ncbi:hypothetical protein BDV25DRAFT_171097 [Aspergillus avenaceus]|uniref:U1-type domain-containing protein n=1 Tax=Aspergillus avenaceus TaxID=36643 RepID=A0A5N6U0F8_ASPAV|nr:hypothetical protein BDV25DRAFT_171097 [Aspergillus avenaceus]